MKSQNSDWKERLEMEVFREFAAVCPLSLRPDTASSQKPPRPDIRCNLESGGSLAFELVECADVTCDELEATGLVAVTKPDKVAHRRRMAIVAEYEAALLENRVVQPERFEYHNIEIDFDSGASSGMQQSAIPRAIDLLNRCGPGFQVLNDGVIRSIKCQPWVGPRGAYAGPSFFVDSYFHVGVYVVERIKTKVLEKSYESDAAIHLLAWSQTASSEELKMLGKDRELADFLKSNGMGPFDRVWVFGRGDNAIAFDSADG